MIGPALLNFLPNLDHEYSLLIHSTKIAKYLKYICD